MKATRHRILKRASLLYAIMICLGLTLAGCSGDDGNDGAQGATGAAGAAGADGADGADGTDGADGADGETGPEGPEGPAGTDDPIASADPESCATCHGGIGDEHQAIYDGYVDESALAMTFNSVTSVPDGAGGFDVTLEFTITDNGRPFIDEAGLPSLDQKRFYAVQYDSAIVQYLNGNKRLRESNVVPGASPGDYVLTQPGMPYAPETPEAPFDGSHVYGYIARGILLEHEGGSGSEIPEGSHVHLYEDVANAAIAYDTGAVEDPDSYVSAANPEGCETCHGAPYLKHGFRAAAVDGVPDFAACKSCHYDDRGGGHEEWQYMVDDPLNWATVGLPTTEVETRYAYLANVMNDTHMSHAMEFPYPQSMSNCAQCHDGKLDMVLDDSQFTLETCKSCHPVDGFNAWPEDAGDVLEGDYAQAHRAPPLQYIWTESGFTFHDPVATADCQNCHGAGAPGFSDYHTGYDAHIRNADGEKYADLYTVSIDDVSVAGDLMTIEYSASDTDIVPEVLVSFYGWDSKQFIVPSHARDGNEEGCPGRRPGCLFEFEPGDDSPLFPSYEEVAPGSYVLTVDMAAWNGQPDTVPNLIADGKVRTAEVTITPQLELEIGGDPTDVVLEAVGQTLDLASNDHVDDYFKGANATVDIDKCNVCHEVLASSFHDGSGRGGDGIQVCKNCHNPTFPGSHVEMASRSIDSYTHAIHSFQDFDIGDTFEEFDPVHAKRYDQHIKHTFPNFTIRNCEACHLEGAYNVPDQSQSMPGVMATSDGVDTWYEVVDAPSGSIPGDMAIEDTAGRNIGSVPEYVAGPASRACGGCHRADLINADLAGDLASFNAHTEAGGTLVENDDEDEVLFGVIDKIMSMFE